MLIFPDIDDIKFKIPPKTKRERLYSSIYPINFQKELKQINNLFSIIPMPPTKITLRTKSCKKSKEKNGVNKFFSVITPDSEKINLDKDLKNDINTINNLELLKIENEIIPKTIEFNKTSRNKRSFFSNKANYKRNLVNIFSNKLIDIDKFIEEINSFLLPNDKTFENIQNLINDKIKMNKNTLKNDVFNHLLKSKEIPINTYNYELIFRYIFNNTFKESFKKALLNKTLITKKEIKEEYQKQINNIKYNLSLHNKEIEDLTDNKKFESLIINKNSSSLSSYLSSGKLSPNRSNKKFNFEMYNRKIIQTNSFDNIFFNRKRKNEGLFYTKDINFNSKSNTLYENYVKGVSLKIKMDNVKETRLKNIIRKQKFIIDNYKKLKNKIKNDKVNSIKIEDSFKNIKFFDFLSNKRDKNNNKNEDIINYINNNEKSIKFEKKFIKKIFNKSSLKKSQFNKNINEDKNLFNDSDRDNNNKQNKKLIKENSYKLFGSPKESIKGYEESKKTNDIKIFLKKKKALNIKSFKDYLHEENDKQQLNELKNIFEEKKEFKITAYSLKIIEKTNK